MKSLLFAAFVWQIFPAAQEAENVFGLSWKFLVWAAGETPTDELFPSQSVPRSSKTLTDCPFLNGWTYCFFLEELLAAPAAERWVNNNGTHSASAQPQQSAKLEMTRNERGQETSFRRELSGKLLSIHTDRENVDRVTHTHTANQLFVAFYQSSLNTSAAFSTSVRLSVQGLTAKSWINLGLALTSPRRQYLCVWSWEICAACGETQTLLRWCLSSW